MIGKNIYGCGINHQEVFGMVFFSPGGNCLWVYIRGLIDWGEEGYVLEAFCRSLSRSP